MVNIMYFIELLPLLIFLLPGHYWYVPGSPVNASMTQLPKSQCINHIYHWVYLLHWPIMQIYLLISSQQSGMHQFDLHQVVIFATEVITESAGSSNTNVNTEWLGNPIFILACFQQLWLQLARLHFLAFQWKFSCFSHNLCFCSSTLCIASALVRACALSSQRQAMNLHHRWTIAFGTLAHCTLHIAPPLDNHCILNMVPPAC